MLQGLRSWKSARQVGLLAIAALAIGIGSATAIYSVVQAVLLNPLPYRNPERYFLMFGAWSPNPDGWTSISYPDAMDYAAHASKLEEFGCSTNLSLNLTFNNQPVHVTGAQVSASLMRSLGIRPFMGRWFDDAGQSSPPTLGAVLSERLWRQLGSDPNIIGQPLRMNATQYVVTGVMPGWFHFPIYDADAVIWMPLTPDDDQRKYRMYHYLRCVVKLKPDTTPQQAREELNAILAGLRRAHPGQAEPDFNRFISLVGFATDAIRPTLLLLLVCAAALFLIACANVASILLARSVARARETAARVAFGATLWQLGAQFFAEGLLVSLAGAAGGGILSFALVKAVLRLAADEIPRAEQIAFNWPVLMFALALAVGCGVFFSIWPLWEARRTAPNAVLSEGVRASANARSQRWLRTFVVAEVALAFGLLALGGLVFEQLSALHRVRPGFDPNHLTVMKVFAPESKYPQGGPRVEYETRLIRAIRQRPGIESAGFINLMPLINAGNNTVMNVDGRPQRDIGHSEVIENRFISPDYFRTMKIPLLAGRFFTDQDKQADTMPMIINETLAKLYWPHSDPIGAYVHILAWQEKRFQIVGVVGDTRNYGPAQRPHPEFYLSYREVEPQQMTWAVRSGLDQGTLARELREAVRSVDPEQPIFDLEPMQDVIETSMTRNRLQTLMVGFFAVSALLLAVLGVYGVVSYAVRQRITEMGTRMALGAAPRDLLKLVLADGMKMAGIGFAFGIIGVLACARLLAASELHVEVTSASPFLIAAVLIGACTLLACWFPAWRATNLSPMVAIHSDVHTPWRHDRLSYRVLTDRISEFVSQPAPPREEGADLLASIAEASRHAESFQQALGAALDAVRRHVSASQLYLFLKQPDARYRLQWMAGVEAVPEESLPANSILVGRLRSYSSALPISRDEIAAVRNWAEEHAPHHLDEIGTLDRLEARMAVPLLTKFEITGVLLFGPGTARGEYTWAQRKALRSGAAQLALILENGRLAERVIEQERLRRELMLAAEVQKRLFPETLPETAGLQLSGVCMPARGVGGDYYDFLDLGGRQIGIALADVAGKGIAAALLMSVVQASLRSLATNNGASLSELTSKLSRLLHRSTGASSYATFFYAQVDEQRRVLRYVNAGHNPPFLLRSNGSSPALIEELAKGGMIIGMFAQATYEEAEVELRTGDVLIAYSDGVTEAHNPADEEFGEERLKDALQRTAHLNVDEMSNRILEELKGWMGDAAQYDDLTFVLMKVV
ncbi:MAG: SpoIIE family protein phosphatase [Acidobacteriia bacterium]|nr:SpoIIE family protein phosphatase [Terriglobia bacterium]